MNANQLKVEFWAAVTTFAASCYIVPVNGHILASAGMNETEVATATALVAALATLALGVYARMPGMVAPCMGMNAYFALSIVPLANGDYKVALGACFLAGIILSIIVVSPLRDEIVNAVPRSLQFGLVCGLGIILFKTGMEKTGAPLAMVMRGQFGSIDFGKVGITTIAIALTVFLFRKRNPLSIVAGMGGAVVLSYLFEKIELPNHLVSTPLLSGFGKLDIQGAFHPKFLGVIMTIVFMSLFDSTGTFYAITEGAALFNSEAEKQTRLRQSLLVDGLAATISPLFGTSPTAIFLESKSGICVGGKTGVTAVLVALMFAVLMFFGALPALIPAAATASVLLFIGALMILQIRQKEAKPKTIPEGLAVFALLAIVLFTSSLGYAIAWSFIVLAVASVVGGQLRQLSWTMVGLAIVAIMIVLA